MTSASCTNELGALHMRCQRLHIRSRRIANMISAKFTHDLSGWCICCRRIAPGHVSGTTAARKDTDFVVEIICAIRRYHMYNSSRSYVQSIEIICTIHRDHMCNESRSYVLQFTEIIWLFAENSRSPLIREGAAAVKEHLYEDAERPDIALKVRMENCTKSLRGFYI